MREISSSKPAPDGARCIKLKVMEPEDGEGIAGPQALLPLFLPGGYNHCRQHDQRRLNQP